MLRSGHPPFVSVKFEPVGRIHRFLLPDVGFKSPLQPGDRRLWGRLCEWVMWNLLRVWVAPST